MIDLTLRCPTCGDRADMCFAHGDDWKKRRPSLDGFTVCPRCEGQRYDVGSCSLCGNLGMLDANGDQLRPTPESIGREGMVTVWGSDGLYLGCMGIETWLSLLAAVPWLFGPSDPPCPGCGMTAQVEPSRSEPGRWMCHGCARTFQATA